MGKTQQATQDAADHMSALDVSLIIGLRDYVEQRKWDSWVDDEEAQSMPLAELHRKLGEYRAYMDILHFLGGAYRPDYLEAVADRSARRQKVGPR